jgi:alkylhydroperoxidase family enzyme
MSADACLVFFGVRQEMLGLTDDAIYGLDGSWEHYSPAERAAFALTCKVTVAPASIADSDVAEVRKYYSDKAVAEIVYHVSLAAFFDRLTETSGLQLERYQ